MKQKRVALYLRVSSQEQSVEMQRQDLIPYAEARGWSIYKIYEDTATGTNDRRAALQNCLKDARERKYDILLCWKLDRVFRSLKDCINTLQEISDDYGIQFVSLKDNGIDMTTPSGRLLLHILAAFGEFEASLIRQRVTSGIQAKRKRTGGTWGRKKKVNDEDVQRYREQGLSLSQIARKLGVAKSTIQLSLKRVQKTLQKEVSQAIEISLDVPPVKRGTEK